MIVEVEGLKLEIINRPPIDGEMYVAEGSTAVIIYE